MPWEKGHEKTGGRQKGTPNKATAEFKAFLREVFAEAYKDPRFRTNLVNGLVTLTLDAKTFSLLVSHHVGVPARQVDVTHQGRVTLEQIVAGTVPPDLEDDDDDEPEGDQ